MYTNFGGNQNMLSSKITSVVKDNTHLNILQEICQEETLNLIGNKYCNINGDRNG